MLNEHVLALGAYHVHCQYDLEVKVAYVVHQECLYCLLPLMDLYILMWPFHSLMNFAYSDCRVMSFWSLQGMECLYT